MSDQVKAIVVDANAPGRLSVQPAKLAPAAPTDVTVRVTAISLNRGETKRAVTAVGAGRASGLGFRRRGRRGGEAGRRSAGRRARRRHIS